MLETAREILGGEDAWIVGGAIRDELLGKDVLDLDIACSDPKAAAEAYGRLTGGAVFRLSGPHGAWRVAYRDGRTVDFTPLAGGIEDDLAGRDFTINAIARRLAGGDDSTPFGATTISTRPSPRSARDVFRNDPLRLLRAVRLEDQLGFTIDPETDEPSAATPVSHSRRPASASSASSRSCRRTRTGVSPSSVCSRRSAARSTGSRAPTRVDTACSCRESSASRSNGCRSRTSSGGTLAAC